MIYLCITKDRIEKTKLLMDALAHSIPKSQICYGEPPDDDEPFMVWGQRWLAMDIIPKAIEQNRPFWNIDNGYVLPAKGLSVGYYRFTYNSMSPVLLANPNPRRIKQVNVGMQEWRKDGTYILIAMPGLDYGSALGLNMRSWVGGIVQQVSERTKRLIKLRNKTSPIALADDLAGAWAVVTHSSNVAVDAVLAGIPVFVAPTSPAAPVGRLDLEVDSPIYPDREQWFASLLQQQFTISEMYHGYAYQMMKKIKATHG